MLLLDTSFVVEFEAERAQRRSGPACRLLAAHAGRSAAISVITLGEFAEGYSDPRSVDAFLAPFTVLQLSRSIAYRTAALQGCLSQRLGENDAWIAATALAYNATLVGREGAFRRVPRLKYLSF